MGHGFLQAKVTDVKSLFSAQAPLPISHKPGIAALRLGRRLTTHSTGARVSLPFIVNLSVPAVRRARLIRALGVSA